MQNAYNISFDRHRRVLPIASAMQRQVSRCKRDDMDSFEWLAAFEESASLQAAFDSAVEYLRRDGFLVDETALQKLLGVMVEHLHDAVDRHDVPWFSRGIRRELADHGIAVTKAEELDRFFGETGYGRYARHAVRKYGAEKAAELTAECILFDSPYRGNLAGYTKQEILASWKRLGCC